MNIQEILKKVVAKEELTAEELDYLKSYEPEKDGRIPKDRLDKEIEKRKAAEDSKTKLEEQLEEMKTRLEELETKGMSEADKAKAAAEKELSKLRKQVEDLTKAGNEAKEKAAALERGAKIHELATARKFKNADYLDFKLKSAEIDLNDEDAVGKFFGELEKASPELFESAAKPGTGTGGANQGGNGGNAVNLARLEELRKKPDFTNAEAAEFIKLSQEKTAAEAATNTK